jgi:aspartate/methionine/tyrosine aminotransferase
MVRVNVFEVEQWMDQYENTPGVLNIAETCASSISIDELASYSDGSGPARALDTSVRLTYGPIRGSLALRKRLASLYGPSGPGAGSDNDLQPDDVIVTQGAIAANFLLFYTLIGPGDHVICVYPTYQQLYAVPESLGAEVSLWRLKSENHFVPDPSELDSLVQDNTKVRLRFPGYVVWRSSVTGWQMIVINNPNNPTGAAIPKPVLAAIIEFAKARDIMVFSDEVYRPLFHSLSGSGEMPPPATAFGYTKTIVTGSMSKAYALAGIRVGWIISKDTCIMKALASARDYTTISVSQIDDQIATFALSQAVLRSLLARNMALARENAELLAKFVENHSSVCSWVRPTAGTTAFIKFKSGGHPVDDIQFSIDVLNKTKAFLVPGSKCFGNGEDFKGYVRIGYVSETKVLTEALENLSSYVTNHLAE